MADKEILTGVFEQSSTLETSTDKTGGFSSETTSSKLKKIKRGVENTLPPRENVQNAEDKE